jgi:chromosome segregation ATPase
MAITAAIDLTVKKPSFGSIKSEIKQLSLEAQRAVKEFGAFSPEARRAEQALAEARDMMEDFNDRVAALNPDKFAQINTVVQGVARGFQAAQGAVALFGNQSEELEKTLVKLQGAMALAEGLEGLGKVQQQFGALANTIKGKVVNAFTTLRGAITASGIGLLAVALGYVVGNFEKLSAAVTNAIPGLKTVSAIVGNLVQQFTDFIGVTSQAERNYKAFKKSIEVTNAELQGQIDILSAQGNKETEIFELRKKIVENELNLIKKRRNEGVKLTEEEIAEEARLYAELTVKKKVIDAEEKKYNEDKEKENEAKRKERLKRLQEIENQIEDEQIKKRITNSKDEYKRLNNEQVASINQLSRWYSEQIALANGNKEEIQKLDKLYAEKSLANEAEFNQKRTELNRKADQQIMDAKLSMAKSTVDGLTSLNNILTEEEKKRENIQKGIALVEIAIDSAIAFSGLNAESAQASAKVAGILGPATPLFTAAYYAQGVARILANVAKAKQVLSGGSGQGGVSASPIAINPPNLTSSSLPTETGVGYPQRVFVTEGDISRSQARVGNTKRVSVVR